MKSTIYTLIIALIFLSCKNQPQPPKNTPKKYFSKDTLTNTITFSTPAKPDCPVYKHAFLLYKELFKKLGYNFNAISLPTERALIMANNGQTDGEGGKIIDLDTHIYKNLIKLNEPILTVSMAAYTKKRNIKITSWVSFRDYNKLSVGYINGSTETLQKLQQFIDPCSLTEINDTRHGCEMLAAGRIDIFVDVYELTSYILNTDPALASSGIVCSGKIENYNVYPYINKKYKFLAPEIDSVLQQMKASGEYKAILSEKISNT